MVIFAMSGSLREASSNTEILRQLKPHLPKHIEFIIYDGLARLPHFNPDHDGQNPSAEVTELRGMIKRSSALIISTPEYAHGIPGSLKNALDWLVSTNVIQDKPTGVIFGSASEGTFAKDALVEVLKTMSAKLVPETVVQISGAQAKVYDFTLSDDLKSFLDNLMSQTVIKS